MRISERPVNTQPEIPTAEGSREAKPKLPIPDPLPTTYYLLQMNGTLIAIACYVLAQLGIGWYISRRIRTEDDYLVAGRSLGYGVATFTIFATWFGAETCIGAAGRIYKEGTRRGGEGGKRRREEEKRGGRRVETENGRIGERTRIPPLPTTLSPLLSPHYSLPTSPIYHMLSTTYYQQR